MSPASPRIAGRLAGLASVDLVWRIPELTPGGGAGVDIAVALLGLALDIGDAGFLEELTTWVLLGYVAAVLAPQAYPAKLGVLTMELGYRVPFALVTIVTAAGIRSTSDGGSPVELLSLLALMALGGAVLLASLRWGQGWTLSPEDERFVQLVDAVFPAQSVEAELREDFARPGVLGIVGAALARTAAGMVLVVPAFLSGVAVVVLLLLYPLPDLLVLGWAGLWAVGAVTGRNVVPAVGTADIETRLYDIVEEATRSLKGMVLGTYLLVLVFGFGLLFAGMLEIAQGTGGAGSLTNPRFVWGVGGVLAVLAGSSCYGVWCCLRMARRLPVFLRQHVSGDSDGARQRDSSEPARSDRGDGQAGVDIGSTSRPWCRRRRRVRWFSPLRRWWFRRSHERSGRPLLWRSSALDTAGASDTSDDESDGESDDRESPPPRPAGFVVPPLMAVVLLVTALAWFGVQSTAFALAWPLLLVALACCILVTRRVGSRSVRHDDHHIVAGVAVLVCTVFVIGRPDSLLDALTADPSLPTVLPVWIYTVGVVVWVGYLDDAFRYADAHDDIRRLARGGYLLAFTLVFGLLLPVTGGPYRALFALLLPVTAVGGLALLVTNWFRL